MDITVGIKQKTGSQISEALFYHYLKQLFCVGVNESLFLSRPLRSKRAFSTRTNYRLTVLVHLGRSRSTALTVG